MHCTRLCLFPADFRIAATESVQLINRIKAKNSGWWLPGYDLRIHLPLITVESVKLILLATDHESRLEFLRRDAAEFDP